MSEVRGPEREGIHIERALSLLYAASAILEDILAGILILAMPPCLALGGPTVKGSDTIYKRHKGVIIGLGCSFSKPRTYTAGRYKTVSGPKWGWNRLKSFTIDDG